MKTRCYNPNVEAYSDYGKRGIAVCSALRDSFLAFEEWAYANGYREYLELDRIDNDGGYEPGNCRWATRVEQARNMRSNVIVKIGKKSATLAEWADIAKISPGTVYSRYEAGYRGEELIASPGTLPRREYPYSTRITIEGETRTISQWSDYSGVKKKTIFARLKQGVTGKALLEPPHAGIRFTVQ